MVASRYRLELPPRKPSLRTRLLSLRPFEQSTRTLQSTRTSDLHLLTISYISRLTPRPPTRRKVKGADYIIVGIPPLEIVPTYSNQIPSHFTESERKAALALLKTLTTQYNSEVKAFAAKLKKEARNDGKVFYFDLASLVRSFHCFPLLLLVLI